MALFIWRSTIVKYKIRFFRHRYTLISRHAFLCNLLTEIMRPRFEKPIDFAKDIVDRNITIIEREYTFASLKAFLFSLNIPEYTIIAENMMEVTQQEWLEYTETLIMEDGTHATMRSHLDYDTTQIAPMDKWWKSEERLPGENPYIMYISSRKWISNEV